MNRDDVLQLLRATLPTVQQRFGVAHLALFGSAARDQLRPESDVDVLVAFAQPATLQGYLDLKDFLEAMLHRPVDLVTEGGLKPRARRMVEQELLRVA